jgi:hypothetical protein
MNVTLASTLRLLGFAAAFLAASPAARADAYEDSYNLDPGPGFVIPWPGCCRWVPDNIGWYWTPQQNVSLTAVETILVGLLNGINNNFDLTVTVYTDRPAVGGSSLGSSTFNPGVLYPADPPWHTKPFDTPIIVNAGTTYFVGFSGWNNSAVPGTDDRGGINWVTTSAYTLPPGARVLGSAYLGDNFADKAGPPDAIPSAPVIKFVGNTITAVPEPGTWIMFCAGLMLLGWRTLKQRA